MNSVEINLLKGAVGVRLGQVEFKRLEDEITSCLSKTQCLERKIGAIMKYAGVDIDTKEPTDHVAFSAILSKPAVFRSHETIIFDEVVINDGDGFNPLTGDFTAPVVGNYLFSVTTRAQSKKQVSTGILCNGSMVGRITSGHGGMEKGSSSLNLALALKAGDQVMVKQVTNKSGHYYGKGFSHFSGYLINYEF